MRSTHPALPWFWGEGLLRRRCDWKTGEETGVCGEKSPVSWLVFGVDGMGIREAEWCFRESGDVGFVLKGCVSGGLCGNGLRGRERGRRGHWEAV